MHLHQTERESMTRRRIRYGFLIAFEVFAGTDQGGDGTACEPLLKELDELTATVAMGYPAFALAALDGGL